MMVDANYIVVIDIETSRFIGMVGRKNEDGTVSVLAAEKEDAGGCIRRGNIYNKESTSLLMKRLVEKLQNRIVDKLSDHRIKKVYVGVGGQSLHSVDRIEMKPLSLEATVSKNDLYVLEEQCRTYCPDLEDVVGIAPPVYYVDGKQVERPEGLPARRIEARYKLITGRPSIRKNVVDCVNTAGFQLEGLIVSPLALAEATLGRKEKDAGCALIAFDTGVTSVAVYRQGTLTHLSVIPLGARLITRDLMKTLELKEDDAEWLKVNYGLSLAGKEKNSGYSQGTIAIGGREVEPKRLNTVIEGRIKEIVENVYERVGDVTSLGAGIVLAGNASDLKELPELLRQRFNLEVTPATIRREWMEISENRVDNPDYRTAVSLLIQGTENCLQYIPPPIPSPPPPPPSPPPPGPNTPPKGRGKLRVFIDQIKDWGDLFAEEEDMQKTKKDEQGK
ncbi:MAG: cell division protein FtsA [Tannerella sp.]|jgi:cell division protein FtsA|nr:cell division protein FtsA [Tannerella sp.]